MLVVDLTFLRVRPICGTKKRFSTSTRTIELADGARQTIEIFF